MILASMDRCQSFYRICDVNGDVYPSAQTKLHRPDAIEGCFAACDHRIQLNDDYDEVDLSTVGDDVVCQRCVPRKSRTSPEPPDPTWAGVRSAGARSVLVRRNPDGTT